jgi:hypothetical protein
MEMIQKSDLVVANSSLLAEYAGQWNPNSVDIGQGCNLKAFIRDDLAEPRDMKSIPRPIAGYWWRRECQQRLDGRDPDSYWALYRLK